MLSDSLKDLLDAPTTGCVVHRWILEQGPDVADLIALLKTKPGLNLSELFRVLTEEAKKDGYKLPFGKTVFTYHMRGGCSCPRA